MGRIERFVINAGWKGTIQTLLMIAAFCILLGRNAGRGDWVVVVPVLVVTVWGTYPLRNLLVAHLRTSTYILNALLAIALIGAIVLGRRAEIPPLAVSVFCGLYMGCFFWMMSDPRVERAPGR